MHEIITIHVGQCGTCIGLNYWESLADEHGLNCDGNFIGSNPLQVEKIGVNFDESSSGRYVPRAVFADMDSTAISALSANACSGLFRPENRIEGPGEAASNFGRGFASAGAKATAEATLNAVQRQLELSDRVRAIHIVHSLGGGTGSGLTSRLLQNGLSGVPVHTFSLFPSQTAVVEAYNSVLCAPHLASHAELTYCWDLAGLRSASGRPKPDIEEINQTAASMMLGLTACVRFPGQQNLSPSKLASALVPLPRLHFLLPALAASSRHGSTVRELASRMLSTDAQLATCDPAYIFGRGGGGGSSGKDKGGGSSSGKDKGGGSSGGKDKGGGGSSGKDKGGGGSAGGPGVVSGGGNDGGNGNVNSSGGGGGGIGSTSNAGSGNGGGSRILSAAGIFRGRIPMQALDAALTDLRSRRESMFPTWLTHAFSVGVCDIPPRGETVSAAFFVNSSSAAQLVDQQAQQVRKLFASGRAFFHLYQQEGITDADMTEALDECDRLCKLYTDTANA